MVSVRGFPLSTTATQYYLQGKNISDGVVLEGHRNLRKVFDIAVIGAQVSSIDKAFQLGAGGNGGGTDELMESRGKSRADNPGAYSLFVFMGFSSTTLSFSRDSRGNRDPTRPSRH